MLRIIFLLILSVTLPFRDAPAQEIQSTNQIITEYFENARQGVSSSISAKDLKAIPFHQLIEEILPLLQDTDQMVRYKAIDLLKRAGELSSVSDQRKTTVALLTEACKDPNGGNSGTASKALLLFNREDFTPAATDSFATLLSKRHYYFDRIIRIAGFLQLEEDLSRLKNTDSTLTKKELWALELALARTGNKESLNYCLNKIKSVPVNDNTVNYLFPDLAYIRQSESLQYMLHEILSDEKKCKSSNPDKEEEIICAFRIMEIVAPVIQDFPVKMTDYGELDIEDYDLTLLSVRKWINEMHLFAIIQNIY
jgi:hypothetical protein